MLIPMTIPDTLHHTLATAADPGSPSHEMVARGFGLLLVLLTAGVLLIVVVLLLLVLRRNRHAQQRLDRRLTRPSSRASAWHAAGARAEPIHPDPDLPSDDDIARGLNKPPANGLGIDEDADPNDETGLGESGPDRDPDSDPSGAPDFSPDDSGPWDLPDRTC